MTTRFGRMLGAAAAVFLWFGFEPVLAQTRPASDPVRSVIAMGPEFLLSLPGGVESSARFGATGVQLADGRRLVAGMVLNFSHRKFMNRNSSPNRIVTLWTGERFPAAWSFGLGTTESATLYGDFISRPMATDRQPGIVATIRQPVGTVDMSPAEVGKLPEKGWHVTREGTVEPPPATENTVEKYWGVHRLSVVPAFENGLVLLAGRWPILQSSKTAPTEQADLPNGGRLRFVFQAATGDVRNIEVQGFGALRRVILPDGRVRTFNAASSTLQVRIEVGTNTTLSCGGRLVGRLPKSLGKLVSIEAEGPFVRPQQTERDSWRGFEVREPLVRRLDDSVLHSAESLPALMDSICHAADQDRVILTSGDELYGKVGKSSRAVTILPPSDKSNVLRISRDQVSALCFARPERSRQGKVTGVFSRIDLVPDDSCSVGGIEEPFWIRTAITGLTQEELFTQHPALGMVNTRWPMIRRIVPLFEGTYRLLDSGPKHLGNAYRESFSTVKPDGTKLEYDFELKTEQLDRPIFLSADIAEMIPAAKGTLKVTPFLDDVRAGFLATRVYLNNELVGTLNEVISVRSPATEPERVRLRLPNRLLKAGENQIVIRQSSASDDSTSFDDCELRAVAIEIEHPVDFLE